MIKPAVFVAFVCMVLASAAGAQAKRASPEVSASDPFAADYAAAVAAYRAAIDFSEPLAPTPNLAEIRATGVEVVPPAVESPAPEEPAQPVADSPAAPSSMPVEPEASVKPAEPRRYGLGDILAMAAAANPALLAAKEAESAAAADLAGAKGRRLPSLKAETSGTYIGNPLGPITITKGQLGSESGVALPPRDIIIYKGMESSQYNFKLIGEVPVFTWGKISLGIDLARTGLAAAAVQRRKAERELAVKARGTWDALGYLAAGAEVLALQGRIGARLVDIAERSAAAGFITRAELASARIRLKEVDIAAVRLDERLDRLLSELASIAGLPALASDELALEAAPAGRSRWDESAAQDLALEGSLDLALLASLVEAKEGLRDLAEKEAKGLPDIGLRVELSYGGSRFPLIEKDWFGQDDYQLTFSLGTSGNIFGNAVKAGEAAKARAQLAEARAQRSDAERAIRTFVRESYLGAELARARLEYASLRQDGYAAELEQARAELGAGAGSESDYLSTMIEALGGLAEAYGLLAEYRSGLLGIEAAVGEAGD